MNVVQNLPNWLTYFRLGLVPILVLLLALPSPFTVGCAIAVFIVACVTDGLDGWIARRWGAVTDIGKLLDPLADKILVMAALVMLAAMRSDVYGEPWVPGWLVVMVLARELWVTGLRGMAASRGVVVAAGFAGKVKSVLQMIAVVLLLLHDVEVRLPFFDISVTCQLLGVNFLILSIGLSYWSAYEYSSAVFARLRDQ